MIKNTYHIGEKNESGSALVVTIMLTSVMLILAVVVLQRLIPYSRQVRNMQDSTQAYYAASSEVEKALHAIATGTTKNNAKTVDDELVLDLPVFNSIGTVIKATPNVTGTSTLTKTANKYLPGVFSTIDQDKTVPLGLKLYSSDAGPTLFGTSKINPANHTLPAFGSLTFDMTGVGTDEILELKFIGDDVNRKIALEFVYQKNDIINTFFGEIETSGDIEIDIVSQPNIKNTATDPDIKLGDFFTNHDCDEADYCSLTLSQKETTIPVTPVDFTLNSDTPGVKIPDLNTVIIADGLSENGEYYSRIIEVKEKTQGI